MKPSRAPSPARPLFIVAAAAIVAAIVTMAIGGRHLGKADAPIAAVLAVGGVALAVYALLKADKSKAARFEQEPGAMPGEALRGRVFTGLLTPLENVQLRLRLIHEWTEIETRSVSRGGFGRRRSNPLFGVGLFSGPTREVRVSRNETLWEATEKVEQKSIGGSPSGFTIPVVFQLPDDARVSGMEGVHRYRWQLDATAAVPGVDFHAAFEVRVGR